MFIRKLTIQNFRLFSNDQLFEIEDLSIPDGQNTGSGLNLFVGENGCGKTSLLDALALPLLSYKADNFDLADIYNPDQKTNIQIFAEQDFNVKSTMPNSSFKAKGFSFEAGVRARGNKSYLSSIVVNDQKYIKADGESKPSDTSPDLRTSVNNPWSGSRFSENDILFLDKNRTYQIKTGTYNSTRFDRLMEDFDYQYITKAGDPIDFTDVLKNVSDGIENRFLKEAITKFQEICGEVVSLEHINNRRPFNKAFFAVKKDNHQHVSLDCLGSGYEMFFSLIYSFYLSKQSEKQLIVLIDEPELHFHPKLQEDFVKVLSEFSTTAQIMITTHSPLFVKQVQYVTQAQINILKKVGNKVTVSKMEEKVLPYLSANEINFIAFDLPTEEYHNELYEELKVRDDQARIAPLNFRDFDSHYFQTNQSESANFPYKGIPNQVSIHTFLRNQIHHRGTAGHADIRQIKDSIIKMRGYLLSDTSQTFEEPTNTEEVVMSQV